MKSLKLAVLIIFTIFSEASFCQVLKLNPPEREGFRGETHDAMYWNDTRFNMSKSPLSSFEDFKNIYSNIPTIILDFTVPIRADKNYSVIWAIEKNYLYLYDVSFDIDFTTYGTDSFYYANYPQYRQAIEKLTERKFVKRNFSLPVEGKDTVVMMEDRPIPIHINGVKSKDTVVMKATWFSDTLYVKQFDFNYGTSKEPFYRMIFERGKLIQVDMVTKMKWIRLDEKV
jgi:hypothetical protein